MGILIAIEGTDSSGKQTQSELIFKNLVERGIKARLVSFPAYNEKSSALVKMYLAGEFGDKPSDVNAYAAASFYAVDRYATFKKDWKKDYDSGTVIVADRYVPSNMIHQAAKLKTDLEKEKFIDWLVELEYEHFTLPRPDVAIFLNMPVETAAKLMAERANKIDNSSVKDIHERDVEYMKQSYNNAVSVAHKRGWQEIFCAENNIPRSIEDINADIMQVVDKILHK